MATISIVIRKTKKMKDGSLRLYIQLCHNGGTSLMATEYSVDNASQFKDGRVIKRADANIINLKIRSLLNDIQEILDSIPHKGIYTCQELRKRIDLEHQIGSGMTYQEFCLEYIEELRMEGRENYALLIERSCRYLTDALGNVPLSDFTPYLISIFTSKLKSRKRILKNGSCRRLSQTTINMMLSQVKSVINRALSLQKVRYDVHPFTNVKIQRSPVKDVGLSIENFNSLRSTIPTNRKQSVALDCFMLSFYLGGINLIDMLGIDFRKDEATYVRTKTRNRTSEVIKITIPIVSKAKEIASKYLDKDGKLDFGFNLSYHNLSVYMSKGVKELAHSIGIEGVIYYSARKSFAQFASDLGIPDSIIDYCLGHSDSSRGVIRHYSKVGKKSAAIAIEKVADYIEHPNDFDTW